MQFDFVYLFADAVVVLRYFGNVFTLIEMFIANRIEVLHIQVSLSNGNMCRAQITQLIRRKRQHLFNTILRLCLPQRSGLYSQNLLPNRLLKTKYQNMQDLK